MIYIYTALRFPKLLKKLNQLPFTSCTDPDFELWSIWFMFICALLHRQLVSISYRTLCFPTNTTFLIINVRVWVPWWDSFTVWPVEPHRATWLWTNQMSACVLGTHPILWGALWGAEVSGWGTWGERVYFLPGTHGICRLTSCCVFDEVWCSVSQNEGRALGPTLLSSVQLDTLDQPPQTENLMDGVGWIWMKPNLVRLNRKRWMLDG